MCKTFGILLSLLVLFQTQFADGNNKNTTKGEDFPVYRVATVLNYPWMMAANTGYEGILVDLLEEIAEIANFTFSFDNGPNKKYGRIKYTAEGIQVNGVIGDLVSNTADLAVADLMISEIRSSAVAFSSPFATTGAQILMRQPDIKETKSFGLLFVPFSLALWICIIAALLISAAVQYIIDRHCQPDWRELNALRSLHYTLSLFLLKDTRDLHPVSTARRIVSVFCWTFSLIIIVSYTASLAAYILSSSTQKPAIPFKTFDQMSKQTDVQYGGWYEMPLNLNDNVQMLMNRHIRSRYTYYFNIEEAVEKVLDIDKPFAAVVEGYEGQKVVNQNCELMLLQEKLFEIDYGLACRRDNQGQQLCSDISEAITNLTETGKLFAIMDKWWRSSNTCDIVSEDSFITGHLVGIILGNFKPIDVSDMLLAFVLQMVGIVLSISATVVEQKCWRTDECHKDCQDVIKNESGSNGTDKPQNTAKESRFEETVDGIPVTD